MSSSSRDSARSLQNAPLPLTVSPAAREELRKPPAPQRRTLREQRALCDGVQRELGSLQLQRYGVAMRDGESGGVPTRIFSPAVMPPENRECVLLNLHGGGFSKDAGSITENVPIAALTRTTVVAARYRMAPEHPFPAAVDDAERVYRALLQEYSPDRVGLYGTSAGAVLCSQLLVRLQRNRIQLPAVLGFFTGTADLSRPGDSEHFFRPPEDDSTAQGLFAPYLGGYPADDPQVSAIFAELSGFPPTLCVAGTRDFFLSQTALFHQALLRNGVHSELVVFEAMPHAHWIYLDLPESTAAFEMMANFLRRYLTAQPLALAHDEIGR
jgi:epsilon-lactone hydrolase